MGFPPLSSLPFVFERIGVSHIWLIPLSPHPFSLTPSIVFKSSPFRFIPPSLPFSGLKGPKAEVFFSLL